MNYQLPIKLIPPFFGRKMEVREVKVKIVGFGLP